MTEPLATGVTAVHSAGVKIGDSVVVIGVGHIGLCVMAAAKAAGAAPLIAVDLNQSRLDVALDMGANYALNPSDTDIIQAVVDMGAVCTCCRLILPLIRMDTLACCIFERFVLAILFVPP